MNAVRSLLYFIARLMGDVSAVRRGTVGKRLGRRVTGRAAGKLLRSLWR